MLLFKDSGIKHSLVKLVNKSVVPNSRTHLRCAGSQRISCMLSCTVSCMFWALSRFNDHFWRSIYCIWISFNNYKNARTCGFVLTYRGLRAHRSHRWGRWFESNCHHHKPGRRWNKTSAGFFEASIEAPLTSVMFMFEKRLQIEMFSVFWPQTAFGFHGSKVILTVQTISRFFLDPFPLGS